MFLGHKECIKLYQQCEMDLKKVIFSLNLEHFVKQDHIGTKVVSIIKFQN